MERFGLDSLAGTVMIGSFVLLFIATSLAFGVTEAGHVAVMQSDSITAEATELTYGDGPPPSVTIGFRFTNPTPRPVWVTSTQEVSLVLDGQTMVRSTTPSMAPWPVRIPADGTADVRARIGLEEPRPTVRSAIRNGTVHVTGVFNGRIESELIQITAGGEADG